MFWRGTGNNTFLEPKNPSLDFSSEAPAVLFLLRRPPWLGLHRLPGFEMRGLEAGHKAGVSAPA